MGILNIKGYRIIRELGSGGMATVYEAIQESLDRPVALKVMAPSLSADRAFASRFLKEGRTVARLNHPNIVAIHDIGEFEHRHYMAMEYLDDGDLKARIRKGLIPEQAISILKQIAQALDYAHGEGFIHRDVKPENILFSKKTAAAKLGDFGIAKAVDETSRLTGTGMSIGTPHYMSPEQGQGEHDLDGRSDLYSLGIVFYEMLTGKVPFDAANTVGIVMKHVQAPVPELPAVLARFQPILDGLLAKDRNHRFSSATELIKAIEAIQSGVQPRSPRAAHRSPNKTTVIPTPPRPGVAQRHAAMEEPYKAKQSSSHGFVWALGGAVMAAVVAIGIWYYLQPGPVTPGGATRPVTEQAAFGSGSPNSAVESNQPSPLSSQATTSPLEQQLATSRSGVRVSPTPATARIYVDAAYAGTGTLELTELPGARSVTIRAEAEGYESREQVIRVPTDRILQLDMILQKVIRKYALTINTDPADAKVRILNIESRYQPGMMLVPGRYHIEASMAGYETKTTWLEIRNQAVIERLDLNRALYSLTVEVSPKDATINLLDSTHEYRAGMKLASGRYRLEVLKSGFLSQMQWIEIIDRDLVKYVELSLDSTVPRNAKLKEVKKRPSLWIDGPDSHEWVCNVELLVDGKLIGKPCGSSEISITSGTHTVLLRLGERKKNSITRNFKPGHFYRLYWEFKGFWGHPEISEFQELADGGWFIPIDTRSRLNPDR